MGPGLKRRQVLAAVLAMACGISCCAAQGFIQVSQQLLAFGDVGVGDSTDLQTITLQNFGNPASLPLITIKPMAGSPDGQFTLMGGTCTTLTAPLQATATCTLLVKANPSVAGTVQAVLQATANSAIDGIFNAQPVMLTANGAIPQLTLAPALDFGNVLVGTQSAAKSLFILNTGTVRAVLGIYTVFINATSSQFTAKGGNCFTIGMLAPGGSCVFTIVAIPNIVGKSTQQFVLEPPAGAFYGTLMSPLSVNGVSTTMPIAPAPSPSPSPSPSPVVSKPLPKPMASPVPSPPSSPSPSPKPSPSPRRHHRGK